MDIPEWIMQPRPADRPTEVFVPVKMGVVPVSLYDGNGNGWQAEVYVELLGEYAGNNCDHCHQSTDEAFACAQQLAHRVAHNALAEMGAAPAPNGRDDRG